MGSVGEVLPSRDSTRIAKHTFDAAKIGIISESCKYFAFYFHFLPPRTFNPRDSLIPPPKARQRKRILPLKLWEYPLKINNL